MISLMEKVNALNNGKIEKKSKKLGDKDYSEIKQWPLQIDLVPEKAPFYHLQDFLIASDCTAFAYGNFHRDLMKNHITLIGCQKLKSESYFPKLTKIFIENNALISSPLVYALEYKNNNKLIGHVIFHEYDSKRYEIGWIISEEYWNQGIADEITKSLINFARKKLIHSLIIECDPRQNKTIKLAVRNGFKLINDKELHIYELVL